MKNSSKNVSLEYFSSTSIEKFEKIIDQLPDLPEFTHLNSFLHIVSTVFHERINIPELIKKIKLIKNEIVSHDKFFQNHNILLLMCNLYVFCFPKHPCKHHFASLLLDHSWSHDLLSSGLVDCFSSLLNNESVYLNESQVIEAIEHLYTNFSSYLPLPFVLPSLEYIRNTSSMHRQDFNDFTKSTLALYKQAIHNICADLRCAVILMQQFKSSEKIIFIKQYIVEQKSDIVNMLSEEAVETLKIDDIGWETWNAAGSLLMTLKLTFSTDKNFSQLKQMLNLEKSLSDGFSCGSFIGLCSGCLSTLNWQIVKFTNRNSTQLSMISVASITEESSYSLALTSEEALAIPMLIFNQLQTLSNRIETMSDQVSLVKCFLQWTITLKNYIKEYKNWNWDVLYSILIWQQSYAIVCLDSPVDVIRHQAKDIITNIFAIGAAGSPNSNAFIAELSKNAFLMDWHKRSIYVFLQCASDFVSVEFLLKQEKNLREKLLTACQTQSLAPYSAQLYFYLASKHSVTQTSCSNQFSSGSISELEFWFEPVLTRLLDCNPNQSRLLVDYCLVKLLKLYGAKAVEFLILNLKDKRESFPSALNVLIMSLRTSQRLGLLQKNGTTSPSLDENKNFDLDLIKSALVCHNNQIRLDSFCLLCESWKPTTLIKPSDLDLVKFCLPYNMNCQCPSFRQQFFSSVRKFLQRLSINVESLQKKKKNASIKNQLIIYLDFKFWLINFCLENLFPGACYPRKSLSLSILHHLVTSMFNSQDDVKTMLKLFSEKRLVALVGLLKDSYDENRQKALDIISNPAIKNHVKKSLGISLMWDFLESSLHNGRKSCKPEVCRDSAYCLRFVSRILQGRDNNVITCCRYFVSSLRCDVKLASKNLLRAVETGPMHGSLLCLRMLLVDMNINDLSKISSHRKLIANCLEICYQVASAVFPVVGCDSPEGYVPEVVSNMELPAVYQERFTRISIALKSQIASNRPNDSSSQANGQRMLVMCWRSAKESYLLLQLISSISSINLGDPSKELLSWKEFLCIGEHLRRQLVETVHRGTFEVAYSSFRDYCLLLWRSKNSYLNSQPKRWIMEIVNDLCEPLKAKGLCSTRRSAGLPFLMQALLGCEKTPASRDCLRHVMNSLLPLVNCDVIVSLTEVVDSSQQIHTLNVLRGLMRDASLGDEMAPYLSKCVMASITGFRSCTWSIRNSSTLLFSTLITRIFGVKKEKDIECSGKNRMSSHEFFSKMPELHEFLSKQLAQHVKEESPVNQLEQQSSLYPVLLLLSRVYPSPRQHDYTEPLDAFLPLLIRCGHSPIIKCRTMAANALVSVCSFENVPALVDKLAQSLSISQPSNQIHGTLLQLQKLVHIQLNDYRNLPEYYQSVLRKLLTILSTKLHIATTKFTSAVVRSSFINLILDIAGIYYNNLDVEENTQKNLEVILSDLLKACLSYINANSPAEPGHTILLESAGFLFARCWVWKISPKSITYPLRCRKNDLTLAFLRALKKYLHKSSNGLSPNTDLSKELEEVLIEILSTTTSKKCQTKAIVLLSMIVSHSKCYDVLELTRRLANDVSGRDDKLVGAIITCQGACLKKVLDKEGIFSLQDLKWLCFWFTFLKDACSHVRHDVCVRLCVAKALRKLSPLVLIDASRCLGVVSVDAWKILFLLLVDEDEIVRKVACQIVNDVAKSCLVDSPGELCVDSLSLEHAMSCVMTLYCNNAAQLEVIFAFLLSISSEEEAEDDPRDDAVESLFDHNSSNSFLESFVLQELVKKFHFQKS